MNEKILCAAIHYDNGIKYIRQNQYGVETGFVLCGYRHPHIIDVLSTNPHYVKNKFEENDEEFIRKYNDIKYKWGKQEDLEQTEIIQGFLTSKGRFVDRKEAFKIALNAGQINNDDRINKELFSEDIY